MKRLHAPLGLIGRIFAILLLAILVEFGISTVLYERASQVSVRDDEARRLAEHLVIARKLLAEQPRAARPELSDELTTARYGIRWSAAQPEEFKVAPSLDHIHEQVVDWEPALANTHMRLRLTSPGRNAVIVGSMALPDGSYMQFSTREPLHHLSFSIERILLALTPAVALILIGGVLVRQTLLPMRRLAQAAERVGSGSAEEVPLGGPGEVRRVITAFNRMQARIHRLIEDRTQALAAVGHDMRTPLARLRLRADAIEEDGVRESIHTDIEEMEAMIGSLLAYLGGEGDPERPVPVDVAVMCATLADDATDRGFDADYVGPDHLERRVRPLGLKRALMNLVDNALHYAGAVRIHLEEVAEGVRIRVEDEGPGIPEEAMETVLEPFVRLDRARSRDTLGLGLGLSIVARAVEEEGGRFTLANRPEGGLRAEILLLG